MNTESYHFHLGKREGSMDAAFGKIIDGESARLVFYKMRPGEWRKTPLKEFSAGYIQGAKDYDAATDKHEFLNRPNYFNPRT